MRIAKWTLIVLGSLLVLLAAAVFVITSVIDPNRYRGQIEAIVGDLAGRPLVIEGNLEITWFPWLGVRMGAAHFDNPPGVSGPPIVEWQSIRAAVKVLPLLRGEVVIDRIRLQTPHIRLRRVAHGRGNWEDLGPRTPSSPSRQASPPRIAGLEIRDGTLEYVDETRDLQITVSSLELDIGQWRAGQSLPVRARFLVRSDSIPPNDVWAQVDAPEIDVRLAPLNVVIPKLSVRVVDAEIKGDLTYAETIDAHVSAHGSAALQAPSVRRLAAALALDQTMPHDPTTLGALELTTRWRYVDGLLAAKPLALKLDGVTLDGWVERGAPPKTSWQFELHGDSIDLGRYVNVDSKTKKPFELPVDSLRALNANGSLVFDQAQLADAHMSDIRLRFQTPEAKP